ncbi:MAG: ABC transporter permease [Firmicutes bacterium]|nr:ABC transporter permease [Bacillota bacterium]
MHGNLIFILDWLAASIRYAAPVALASVGSVYSERSGIFNIGIEGMMLIGAFFGILGSYYTDSVLVGVMAAMLAGLLCSLIHAYMSVTLSANQIISGQAINLLAVGITNFLNRALLGHLSGVRVPGFAVIKIPLLHKIPIVGQLFFQQTAHVYLAYLIPIIGAWILYRTTWGLNVRAAGEHPQAVRSAGLSVERIRYATIALSGLMAGLGGAAVSLGEVRIFTQEMTGGRGFVVLAAIVVGKWNPALTGLACLLFGGASALQTRAQTLGALDIIPHQFYNMLPYLLTCAALAGFVGRTVQPEKLGEPYDPEQD